MHEIDSKKWFIVSARVITFRATKESIEYSKRHLKDFTMPRANKLFYCVDAVAIKGVAHGSIREFYHSIDQANERVDQLLSNRYCGESIQCDPVHYDAITRSNKLSSTFFTAAIGAYDWGVTSLERAMLNKTVLFVDNPADAANLVKKHPAAVMASFEQNGFNNDVLWPHHLNILYSNLQVKAGIVHASVITRFDVERSIIADHDHLKSALFFVPIDGANDDQLMLF